MPFVATSNKFCVDTEQRLNDGGDLRAMFFNKHQPYSEYFVCAVLNSTLLDGYHKRHTKPKRGGYYEYFEGQLSKLPIRRISFTTPPDLRTSLVAHARDLYVRSLTAGYVDILAFTDERLAADQTDVIHDVLAFLAQQMIDLNKQKQAEVKRFLAWLEEQIGAKVDDLNGKSIIRGYLGDYQKGEEHLPFGELYDRLYQNRSRIAANLSDRVFEAGLRREYETLLGVLLPIKQQLAHTDRLIDLIVYKLYDLTEEEIAIVEGRE